MNKITVLLGVTFWWAGRWVLVVVARVSFLGIAYTGGGFS